MHTPSAAGSAARTVPAMVLNVDRLTELRRAVDLRGDADFARHIGVDTATLYRIVTGRVKPSNAFIARVRLAFPTVSLDQLFTAVAAPAKAAS